jgi:hypothetical protein
METDYLTAKIQSHRANLLRYATLLDTHLTEFEREYLHTRIEEESAEIVNLELEAVNQGSTEEESLTGPNPHPPLVAPRARPGS